MRRPERTSRSARRATGLSGLSWALALVACDGAAGGVDRAADALREASHDARVEAGREPVDARPEARVSADAGGPDAEIGPARGDGSAPTADVRLSDAGPGTGDGGAGLDAVAAVPPGEWGGPPLGARRHGDGSVEFRVRAPDATRVEVALFAVALGETERLRVPLLPAREGDALTIRVDAGALRAAGLPVAGPLFYGYRVWGPNWPYDPAFTPGGLAGFIAETDDAGHRMNPNKLALDPYALEVSHDPRGPGHADFGPFRGDADHRALDAGPFAPKGVVIDVPPPAPPGPGRALRDQVLYEVHLRGLTAGDPALPEGERGTYAGARSRARALAALGVTAVEFLPLHETPNDQNELTPDAEGDNYWGYSTLSYFAPDRRYAADRSPGGPTRELRDMVRAFHDEGLEVFVDVVFNHTAEGTGGWLSFRPLGDATFYEHADGAQSPARYANNNGVGPNVNTARGPVADLVVDSLRYWHEALGVDGFRFDLAPVVANGCDRGCYRFDRALPERIARELGRGPDGGPGAVLIAEPWGIGAGTYQLGAFPAGWAEWNDRYRDAVRRDLNRLGVEVETLRDLGRRVRGSADVFEGGGRPPAASVNFLTAHDGFTLRDLFAYSRKQNDQPWPWGPSSGGSDGELSWDFGGDVVRQRRAARTALALLLVSHGVPMFVGGDECLRTQRGNNNPYNLDSPAIWLDPSCAAAEPAFHAMTTALLAFRRAHVALRPPAFVHGDDDADADGLPAVSWYRDDGSRADDAYLDAPDRHAMGWMFDGDELGDAAPALSLAYNGWSGSVVMHLPAAPEGTRWHLVADTSEAGAAFDYAQAEGAAEPVEGATRTLDGRSLAIFVAR